MAELLTDFGCFNGSAQMDRLEGELRRGSIQHELEQGLRELAMGGRWSTEGIQEYFEAEKAGYRDRQAAIAREWEQIMKDYKGMETMAPDMAIDSRTYFRWQQEDPHFWEDEANVRRFKQDNPECVIRRG